MPVNTRLSNTGTLTLSDPFKGSVYFDGNGDYLTIPSDYTITGDFTAEAFVYNTGVGDPCILGTLDSTNSQLLRILGGVQIAYFASIITGTISVPNNQWVHLAVSRQGTTVRLFTNGSLSQTATFGGNVVFRYIGALGVGTNLLTGYISNLRVINGRAIYTSSFISPLTSLSPITNTVLLTCQGPTVKDNSPNNFTVTKNGNADYNNLSPFNPTLSESVIEIDSQYSSAGSVYFDGTGDYLETPSNSVFSFGTGNFTVECWVNAPTQSGQAFIIGNLYSSIDGDGAVAIYLGTSNQLILSTWFTVLATTSNNVVIPNTWNHIVYTRLGTTLKIFVNGVEQSSFTNSTNFAGTNGYRFGIEGTTARPFVGYISNARIIKGSSLYTSNFIPPIQPLTAIANTQLLTCQGPTNTIRDASSNNFTVTKNGNAVWRADNPFNIVNSSLNANGMNVKEIDEVSMNSGSVFFNGSGNPGWLSTPSNDAFTFGTGDFTIEAWIYLATGTAGTIFDNRTSSTSLHPVIILANGGTGANDRISVYVAGSYPIISDVVPLTSNWTHVALCKSSGSTRLFINGAQSGSTYSDSNNYAASGTVLIGAGLSGANQLNGYISNVRVLKGTALYTANFTPQRKLLDILPNTSLLLNCVSGQEFKDSSTNNFTITQNSTVATSTLTPFSTTSTAQKLFTDGTLLVKEFIES